MIGIIGAMRVEVDALRLKLVNPKLTRISSMEFVEGQLGQTDVVLAVSGVGKVFAAVCTQTMIVHFGVKAIINTGVAGTLTDELHIGDVAVSTHVVQHDMDTSALGDPVGMISGINLVQMPASRPLYEQVEIIAKSQGLNCVPGVIASGDQFIGDDRKKRWICDTFDAVAVEMESASIGQVSHINQVPFVCIRVISDEASGEAPEDFMEFARTAAATSIEVTQELVQAIDTLKLL